MDYNDDGAWSLRHFEEVDVVLIVLRSVSDGCIWASSVCHHLVQGLGESTVIVAQMVFRVENGLKDGSGTLA